MKCWVLRLNSCAGTPDSRNERPHTVPAATERIQRRHEELGISYFSFSKTPGTSTVWTRLRYAGRWLFTPEEDIYHPANFVALIQRWEAAAQQAAP